MEMSFNATDLPVSNEGALLCAGTNLNPIKSASKSVLIIDDDEELGSMIKQYLEQHNIELTLCHRGKTGLEAALTGRFDLVLLDVMLPDLDGFEVLQKLRVVSNLSVLLLSARGQSADRIRGLQLGADDYLPKPFIPEELAARIHAIIRRSSKHSQSVLLEAVQRQIESHKLAVDCVTRTAWYGAARVHLTDIEFSLLVLLCRSPEEILTREQLGDSIFEREFHPLNRSLDMHVSRLRKKLAMAKVPGNPIRTIHGFGYLFSATVL
jgi:DNA-binding response OmpR family regulator